MQPSFTRGFRLHLSDGRYLDGAEFPSARVIVLDDSEYGFATVATSLDEVLKSYHGARVEWPGDQLVPTALLLDLVNIAAQVADSDDKARALLGQLTKYLGYDVAERAAEQEANRALARGETHL